MGDCYGKKTHVCVSSSERCHSVGVCGDNVVDATPVVACRTTQSHRSVWEPGLTSASWEPVGDSIEVNHWEVDVAWEMEWDPIASCRVSVKGRLKKCIFFWRNEIRACANMISTIEDGYVLPLKSEPTAYMQANHLSANLI